MAKRDATAFRSGPTEYIIILLSDRARNTLCYLPIHSQNIVPVVLVPLPFCVELLFRNSLLIIDHEDPSVGAPSTGAFGCQPIFGI
jgi:hypothetical protein